MLQPHVRLSIVFRFFFSLPPSCYIHCLNSLSMKGKKNTARKTAGKKTTGGRKSTGGAAPRKVLFDKDPAETDPTSTTIDVEMSPALTERVPATQVSLLFVQSCLVLSDIDLRITVTFV
jgi:hypothetical protein